MLLQFGLVLGESNLAAASLDAALLIFLKILFVIAGLIYVAFGVIVIRQVVVMKNTLHTTYSPIIQLLGWLHLALALLVLAFFFML